MDAGKFKEIVISHLGLEYSRNPVSEQLIDFNIQSAASEVANMAFWSCLLKETEGYCTTTGSFIIPEPCIISQVYIGGNAESATPSWRRVLSLQFDNYYVLKNARGQNYPYTYSSRNRYTVNKLKENSDITEIQLLGAAFASLPLKILYYPTMPSISNFTPPFIKLLLDICLKNLFPVISENTPQFQLEMLKRSIKDTKFDLQSREAQIEVGKFLKNKNLTEQSFINNGISDLMFGYGNLTTY